MANDLTGDFDGVTERLPFDGALCLPAMGPAACFWSLFANAQQVFRI